MTAATVSAGASRSMTVSVEVASRLEEIEALDSGPGLSVEELTPACCRGSRLLTPEALEKILPHTSLSQLFDSVDQFRGPGST